MDTPSKVSNAPLSLNAQSVGSGRLMTKPWMEWESQPSTASRSSVGSSSTPYSVAGDVSAAP